MAVIDGGLVLLQPHKRARGAIVLVVLFLLGSRCEQEKTEITPSWDHVVN